MSYGICAECKVMFFDPVEFDEHPCMMHARNMPRLELARKLYENGKMSKDMWMKVQMEER